MRKYTKNDMNEMLEAFNELDLVARATFLTNKPVLITQEDVDEFIEHEEEEYAEIIKDLVGYTVGVKTDGFHKTDGQMVEYTFTFTSPTGDKTKYSTEKCLMVGWNCYGDDIEIK